MPRAQNTIVGTGLAGNDTTQVRRKVRRRRATSRTTARGGLSVGNVQTTTNLQGRHREIPFAQFTDRDWTIYNMGQRHCSTR